MAKNNIDKLEVLVDRDDFIPTTKKTFEAIEKGVKFLFENLFVLESKFLPYNNQLIFITDFFNKIKNPSATQLEILKNWFWTTTYSNYFTIYNLSKQRIAYEFFQQFLIDEKRDPVYFDKPDAQFETLDFPQKIEMGSVRSKALGLFMLKYQSTNISIDFNEVNGYKKYYLFNDIEDINITENTVLIIDNNEYNFNKKEKYLSSWLFSDVDYSSFFITQDLKEIYKQNKSKLEILAKRKELIIEKEKEFVVNELKIKYLY